MAIGRTTIGTVNKDAARSRVTNGHVLLPGIDGRSVWARRAKDLLALHLSDLGGSSNVSEAERSIVPRCAIIETELERLGAQSGLCDKRFCNPLDLRPAASDQHARRSF
jgi:hypothetical protein